MQYFEGEEEYSIRRDFQGEMAQGEMAALSEVMGLIPNTHVVAHKHL